MNERTLAQYMSRVIYSLIYENLELKEELKKQKDINFLLKDIGVSLIKTPNQG